MPSCRRRGISGNEAERSCGNCSLVMLHFRAGQGLLVPEGDEGQRSLQLHKTGSVLHPRQLLLTIVHCFVYFPNFFRSSIQLQVYFGFTIVTLKAAPPPPPVHSFRVIIIGFSQLFERNNSPFHSRSRLFICSIFIASCVCFSNINLKLLLSFFNHNFNKLNWFI